MGQLVGHGPARGDLHALRRGLKANVGAVELAHDAAHGPGLAIDRAHAGAAKLLAPGVVANRAQIFIVQKAVQKRWVGGVDAHLKALQPVGMPQAFEGKAVAGRRQKRVDGGQGRWRHIGGAHPGKHHTVALHHRVAGLLNPFAQAAAQGLGGCVQAAA